MDLGRFALGFLGGAADYGAKQIDAQQKSDAELKKEKMLQELRLQTEKEMAVFNNDLRAGSTDSKQSGPDLSTGKYIYRDENGNVKSSRDLTDSEKVALTQDQQKGSLELQNLTSTIASRAHDDSLGDKRYALDAMSTAASVDASHAAAAHSRVETRLSLAGTPNSGLHGAPGMGNSLDARANELLYQNKAIADGLIASGVPPEAVTQLAQQVVTRAAASSAQGKNVSLTAAFAAAAAAIRAKANDKGTTWKLDPTVINH